MGQTFELKEELLNEVLARALNDDSARTVSFAVKALKPGAGNPTSLGVYRVSGIASTAMGEHPFSVVVKHLANGLPMLDASEVGNWNYWRREIVFFESSLVKKIPSSLGFPKYLGSSNLEDGTALFWNEDLGDLEDNQWTWNKCLQAAELVAEVNSMRLSDDEADFEWLNTSQMQSWYDFMPWWQSRHEAVAAHVAGSSEQETAAAFEIMAPFLADRELIMQIVSRTPKVFSHGDFNLNNLVTKDDGSNQLIALDWQLCGLAPIGTEVAAIFNTAHELGVAKTTLEQFDEICKVYFDKYTSLNPQADVSLEQIKAVAAAMGVFILSGLGYFYLSPTSELVPADAAEQIDEFLERSVNGPMLTYAKVLSELA